MHRRKDKTLVITAGGQGCSVTSLAKIAVQKGFARTLTQQTLGAGLATCGAKAALP